MKNTKTLAEAAEIISQKSEEWDGEGSIYALSVREARKQSKDSVFNIAAWLMFNYGPLYSGETEDEWVQAAKDILKIAK
jgi:hypothetical protein